ncbi:MAG: GTPase Era [Rhodothermales bacterium]
MMDFGGDLLQPIEGYRSGYVALLGKPNVGKSTLMNALVGRKLSIVTAKPQTTRQRILGILTGDQFQIIFLDTPGVIEPRYRLHEAMMQSVRESVMEADLVLFMADATLDRPDMLSLDVASDRPALLLINKMDLIRREEALPLVDTYRSLRQFDEIIPISAVTGFNVPLVLEKIIDRLPEGPPFYPPDMISEHPERFFVAEIIREKIIEQFREEIPYSAQVAIAQYLERADGKDLIDAEIIVERESQKGILIGRKGQALKKIGMASRRDIEEFTGRPVFLRLFVKVRGDWRNRDVFLKSFGYRL